VLFFRFAPQEVILRFSDGRAICGFPLLGDLLKLIHWTKGVIVNRRYTMRGGLMPTSSKRQRVCDSRPVDLPDDASVDALAQLTWAIAHPARVRIIRLLINRKACVCGEIVAELPLAQSTVSQHLKILKTAGLIQGEIDGPKMCYCINRKKLAELKRLIADL
jgi:ArsR family transcriptional regulator